jgi:hypothetical protein
MWRILALGSVLSGCGELPQYPEEPMPLGDGAFDCSVYGGSTFDYALWNRREATVELSLADASCVESPLGSLPAGEVFFGNAVEGQVFVAREAGNVVWWDALPIGGTADTFQIN